MLSNIREDVTRTIAHAQFQMQAPPPLPDLPDFITSHFDPFTASDDTVAIDGGTLGMVTTQLPPMQTARPDAQLGADPAGWARRVRHNAQGPCGRGSGTPQGRDE